MIKFISFINLLFTLCQTSWTCSRLVGGRANPQYWLLIFIFHIFRMMLPLWRWVGPVEDELVEGLTHNIFHADVLLSVIWSIVNIITLYISHVNFKALHAAGNAFHKLLIEIWMSMNESVTECLRFFLPTFLPPSSCSVRAGGWRVVVVGGFDGTDSPTSTSPPSYPVFPLSMNVVNQYCVKSSGQLLAGNGLSSLSWELLLLLLSKLICYSSLYARRPIIWWSGGII